MIPQNRISTTLQFWYYLSPDELEPEAAVDYELGGAGLNNPSIGLQVQVWKASLEPIPFTNNWGVYIEAPTWPKSLLFAENNVSEISLAFDQNMHPFIAFVQNGQAKLWWYDPTVPGQVFTTLAVDVGAPKICLDDKRRLQTASSDVILTYTRSGSLYFRQQRDRFLIEYLLKTPAPLQVLRVGMNGRNRLQWGLGTMDPAKAPNPLYRGTTQINRRITTQGYQRKLVGGTY